MDFLTAAIDHKKLITKENISNAFNLFDTNKDGNIDINEFKKVLPQPKSLMVKRLPSLLESEKSSSALHYIDSYASSINSKQGFRLDSVFM